MIAYLIFIALQIADAVITVKALNKGKAEANPFLVWVFDYFGPVPSLVIVKTAVVVLFGLLGYDTWMMILFCVIYSFVVAHNMRVLSKA